MIIYTPNGSMDFVLTQLFFFFKDRRKFAESNPTDPSFTNSSDPATLFPQENAASALYTTLSGLTAEQKAALRNLLLSEE